MTESLVYRPTRVQRDTPMDLLEPSEVPQVRKSSTKAAFMANSLTVLSTTLFDPRGLLWE
jgi:hypothetical protein